MTKRFAILALVLIGCAEDPNYIDAPEALEFDPATVDPEAEPLVVTLDLPIRLETEEEAQRRAARATELGIDVPYVGRDDLDISLEWTVEHLTENGDATVELFINGGNEYFAYVPEAFIIDPEEDEAPPNLIDGIPVEIGPLATASGVFREDQVHEASLDLDLITRGGLNPFAAILNNDEERKGFEMLDGTPVPDSAVPSLVRFEVGLTSNRAVRMQYAVRIRDRRGILHDELDSAPAEEVVLFMPVDFVPPPPME